MVKKEIYGDYNLVSVIVPVYNVEKYLEECLESVVKQTYTNIEILLMEGKSDDNSLNICTKWARLDPRITLVSRKDGGLGPARNFGIDIARGQYVFFVDSDDFLPLDTVEKLMKVIEDKEADIVAGGYCSVDEQGKELESVDLLFKGCDREISSREQKERYLRRGVISVWGKLYRTEFWKRTGIRMPSGSAEDAAVFPSLVVMADKIICTGYITYYYRKRADSLFCCTSRHLGINNVIYIYCNYLKDKGVFTEYYKSLLHFTYVHLMIWKDRLKSVVNSEEEYEKKVEIPFSDTMKECFGAGFATVKSIQSIGSYNLRFICHKIHPQKGDIHNAFTTTVSQFYNRLTVEQKIYHPNPFRRSSLIDDGKKKVFQNLENLDKSIQLIMLDFLDDVNNIAVLGDGAVMTASEPFLEADIENIRIDHIVEWESDEYWDMWKAACHNLIKCLENVSCDVVLVQSRYCLRYFDGAYHNFPNVEELERKNYFIEKMEKYFTQNIDRQINSITIPADLSCSDAYFHYGCSPEYLCSAGQYEFAEKICNKFNV